MEPHLDLETLIDRCALEPIHIPGKIQAHGFLFACDSAFAIRYLSTNVTTYLGLDPVALLGRSLFSLLKNINSRDEWLTAVSASEAPVFLGHWAFAHNDATFDVTAHWRAGFFIVEFEPLSVAINTTSTLGISGFVTSLQEARTVPAICALAVDEIKRLTGFGRVLGYSFDAEGHGRVIAEAVDPGYDRYLGLHFPASDIPAQARQLYKLNPIRVIPDANYEPAALVTDQANTQPLDLSFSVLRSVSPVHIQYLLNMGTLASMSVSILVEGKLWGLISCHDLRPRQVSASVRSDCELLGKILSLQVEARESHDQTMRRLELRNMIVTMLAAMADKDNVATGLCSIPATSLAFAGAVGAAVVMEGHCQCIGDTPSEKALNALAQWLKQRGQTDIYSTDALTADFPQAADYEIVLAGLLAVSISEIHPHYIFWFRPEVIKTVNWAGQPIKEFQKTAGIAALSPRKSFSSWEQIVSGQSLPWSREEIDAAATLRDSVRGIVLRKAEELANMADELRHANGELEAFSYSVSHDLRAPLRHIAGYAELLQEYEGASLSAKASRYLHSIGESVRFAGTLVDELLAFSQMGRSALRLSPVNINNLIQHIRHELAPDFQQRDIEWVVHPLPLIVCDGAFMHLALRNLLANAIKYSRDTKQARIEIGARDNVHEHIIYIADNGIGFDMRYVDKLFGVFQRLHTMEEFEGTGIGLANVRRIVERHGGRVWAEGELQRGATFYFAIPKTIPSKLKTAPPAVDAQG